MVELLRFPITHDLSVVKQLWIPCKGAQGAIWKYFDDFFYVYPFAISVTVGHKWEKLIHRAVQIVKNLQVNQRWCYLTNVLYLHFLNVFVLMLKSFEIICCSNKCFITFSTLLYVKKIHVYIGRSFRKYFYFGGNLLYNLIYIFVKDYLCFSWLFSHLISWNFAFFDECFFKNMKECLVWGKNVFFEI